VYKRQLISGVDTDPPGDWHAGPTWAFDLYRQIFIPPTVQNNAIGGKPGTWKRDPMVGVAQGDQEKYFMMRHFSDY